MSCSRFNSNEKQAFLYQKCKDKSIQIKTGAETSAFKSCIDFLQFLKPKGFSLVLILNRVPVFFLLGKRL